MDIVDVPIGFCLTYPCSSIFFPIKFFCILIMTLIHLTSAFSFLLFGFSASTSSEPTADQAIFNSIYDRCGTGFSDFGCGYNLVCEKQNQWYSQCVPNEILKANIFKPCKEGAGDCRGGSYCRKDLGFCIGCRSLYVYLPAFSHISTTNLC